VIDILKTAALITFFLGAVAFLGQWWVAV